MADRGGSTCDHQAHPSLVELSTNQSDQSPFVLQHTNSSSRTSSGICLSGTDQGESIPLSQSILSLGATEPSLFSSLCDSRVDEESWADIELISLIHRPESCLPRYRLRVDPCTAFLGYKNKDFRRAKRATRRPLTGWSVPKSPTELTTIPCEGNPEEDKLPVSEDEDDTFCDFHASDDETASLTSEQIERTLDYFLLCGLRVSQMARTYEDLEAITHLLEEKQNDLELAAKIGKTLLDKNLDLERRLCDTETKLTTSEDVVSQLRHNLSVKDNLLQIYSRDHCDDELSDDAITMSPGSVTPPNGADPKPGCRATSLSVTSVNFAHLNRKVRELEEENYVLREERNRLNATADQLDEHETALIRDCARQLVSANMHIRTLSDELAKKSDAFLNQQSEVTRLLTRGLDLESRVKQLAAENEMLVNRLQESQTSQQRIANELANLRDKYDECLALYNESRSEVRALRKRSRRANLRCGYLSSPGTGTNHSTPPHYAAFSLAESNNTMSYPVHTPGSDGSSSSLDATTNSPTANDPFSEASLASELARTAAKDQAASNVDRLFRAMDQARHVRECGIPGDCELNSNPAPMDYAPEDTVSSSGFVSGSEPSDMHPRSTVPHHPGDRRTTTTSHSKDQRPLSPSLSFRPWGRHESIEEQLKRHSWLCCDHRKSSLTDEAALFKAGTQFSLSSDDSVLVQSVRSSDPMIVYGQSFSRLPQRLQLIKTLDGSEVLQHWQRLATPSFTNALFEAPLPGVRSRAGVDEVTSSRLLTATGPNGSSPAICRQRDRTPLDTPKVSAKGDSTSTSRQSVTSRELVHRFGLNSPSQLLGSSSLRSRSVEHVQNYIRQVNPSEVRLRQQSRPSPPSVSIQSESRGSTPATPAQFSLTSLVSSLLPFSLSPVGGRPAESTPAPVKESSLEPIRIRARSPPGSRGLLDVTESPPNPPTLQRAAAAACSSSSSGSSSSTAPISLPSASPPPLPPHTFTRTPYTRSVHNPSLSGITEESSGSPPTRNVVASDSSFETPTSVSRIAGTDT